MTDLEMKQEEARKSHHIDWLELEVEKKIGLLKPSQKAGLRRLDSEELGLLRQRVNGMEEDAVSNMIGDAINEAQLEESGDDGHADQSMCL